MPMTRGAADERKKRKEEKPKIGPAAKQSGKAKHKREK
jgi:hypothetical protein